MVLLFASLFLIPVALIKPQVVFPFYRVISRKLAVGILFILFLTTSVIANKAGYIESFETTKPTNTPAMTSKPEPTNTPTIKLTPTLTNTPIPTPTLIKVTRVIDGDTIVLENGKVLRYIGIDSPETRGRKGMECYAMEAENANKKLVLGKQVRLEKDVSETDRYGRILRYVFVGKIFVNEYLVKEGYAKAVSYPPDIKYQDKFRKAEKYARQNNKGLWNIQNCITPTIAPSPTYSYKSSSSNSGSSGSSNTTGIGVGSVDSTQPTPDNGANFQCNCNKTCSQMSSCAEAYYQLNTCGCTARDGDHDGVPCEKLCK